MKIFISVYVLLLLIGSAGKVLADDAVKAKPAPADLKIDGNNTEWQLPFNLFSYETGLMFNISNDNENLYLCFAGNDEHKIRKMLHAGWKIELQSKDKKNKFDDVIEFPKLPIGANKQDGFKKDFNNTEQQPFSYKKEKLSLKDMIEGYKIQIQQVNIKGFKNTPGTAIPLKNEDGINIDMGVAPYNDGEAAFYEVEIPLNMISDIDLFHLKSIQLNVEVYAMEMPSFNGSGSGEYHHRQEGGGGMQGGRPDSGMRGGFSGGDKEGKAFDAATFSKTSLKQSFMLYAK